MLKYLLKDIDDSLGHNTAVAYLFATVLFKGKSNERVGELTHTQPIFTLTYLNLIWKGIFYYDELTLTTSRLALSRTTTVKSTLCHRIIK